MAVAAQLADLRFSSSPSSSSSADSSHHFPFQFAFLFGFLVPVVAHLR
ncbi:hypothetical protein ACFV0D_00145 [Streptomyces sp. NPDC059556]